MTDYDSTLDLAAATELIRRTNGPILILTHAKPDGDAFGSVIALTAALHLLKRPVEARFVPPVPASLLELRGSKLAQIHTPGMPIPDAELYVILDTGAWSQLGEMRTVIEPNLDRTLILDHHLSGDIPARYRYVDGQAAACSEIVAEVVQRLLGGLHYNSDETSRAMCEALFVGIASDTGWFRFSNTRPQTHELAARLLREGVDQSELYRILEQTERPQKLALLTRALGSMKLLAGGRAALMILSATDFSQTGALEEETERLIDVPQQIGTVEVVGLISERPSGNAQSQGRPTTRLSFRSKPGPNAVNVAELAGRFGGGGHARAAGARVEGSLEQVLPRVEQALKEVLGNK